MTSAVAVCLLHAETASDTTARNTAVTSRIAYAHSRSAAAHVAAPVQQRDERQRHDEQQQRIADGDADLARDDLPGPEARGVEHLERVLLALPAHRDGRDAGHEQHEQHDLPEREPEQKPVRPAQHAAAGAAAKSTLPSSTPCCGQLPSTITASTATNNNCTAATRLRRRRARRSFCRTGFIESD